MKTNFFYRKNLDQLLDEETSYMEEDDPAEEQVGYLAAQVKNMRTDTVICIEKMLIGHRFRKNQIYI